uniref:Uncharacterized protein n=1 Tax=Cacopsylla melanoneura TaxID=428564 RepID=A0A8D9EB02_9HEMI
MTEWWHFQNFTCCPDFHAPKYITYNILYYYNTLLQSKSLHVGNFYYVYKHVNINDMLIRCTRAAVLNLLRSMYPLENSMSIPAYPKNYTPSSPPLPRATFLGNIDLVLSVLFLQHKYI